MAVPNLGAPQQVQAQPRKIELPAPGPGGSFLDVVQGPPGIVILRVVDQPRGDIYLVPMASAYARELGNELVAPSVVQANGNGVAPPE